MPLQEVVTAAVKSGFEELPVKAGHAATIVQLPMYHGGPFDRILIARVLYEPAGLLVITPWGADNT